MIAPANIRPQYRQKRRVTTHHVAREATRRRKAAQLQRRYRDCLQIGVILTAIVLAVVGYLALITHSTSLDNRLMTAQEQRAQLQEDLVMLEDRRAALEARDRLSQIAAHFGMKEHPAMLYIKAPAEPLAPVSRPFWANVPGWFHRQ